VDKGLYCDSGLFPIVHTYDEYLDRWLTTACSRNAIGIRREADPSSYEYQKRTLIEFAVFNQGIRLLGVAQSRLVAVRTAARPIWWLDGKLSLLQKRQSSTWATCSLESSTGVRYGDSNAGASARVRQASSCEPHRPVWVADWRLLLCRSM
jgi:hypothetical protein